MAKLPVYRLTIDPSLPETGVHYVALVTDPAIEVDYLKFSQVHPIKFEVQDQERRILFGPLLIPDQAVFRSADKVRPDHYVIYERSTVDAIVQKFFKDGFTKNVNLMHQSEAQPDGVYMCMSFQSDSKMGIPNPTKFKDLPEGTWYAGYKVENDLVWQDFIKTGELKGFSVECGSLYPSNPESEMDKLTKQLAEILDTEIG